MPPERASSTFVASRPPVAAAVHTLVIGCGNPLCGDDAVGPTLVARLLDRGLPPGMRCVDCGTAGMDVALEMRGCEEVVIVDACRSGGEPGTLFEVPAEDFARLPSPRVDIHAFRWDHAVACARWIGAAEQPRRIVAFLVEGRSFAVGERLSPEVDRAVDHLADHLIERLLASYGPRE
jgi:hydrogenase maturation protease